MNRTKRHVAMHTNLKLFLQLNQYLLAICTKMVCLNQSIQTPPNKKDNAC